MQLDALFFNAYTYFEYHYFVDLVVAHKRIIAKMINKTLESGNGSPLYLDYKNNVELFLSSPANIEVIERFSVSEYLNRGINTKD